MSNPKLLQRSSNFSFSIAARFFYGLYIGFRHKREVLVDWGTLDDFVVKRVPMWSQSEDRVLESSDCPLVYLLVMNFGLISAWRIEALKCRSWKLCSNILCKFISPSALWLTAKLSPCGVNIVVFMFPCDILCMSDMLWARWVNHRKSRLIPSFVKYFMLCRYRLYIIYGSKPLLYGSAFTWLNTHTSITTQTSKAFQKITWCTLNRSRCIYIAPQGQWRSFKVKNTRCFR